MTTIYKQIPVPTVQLTYELTDELSQSAYNRRKYNGDMLANEIRLALLVHLQKVAKSIEHSYGGVFKLTFETAKERQKNGTH